MKIPSLMVLSVLLLVPTRAAAHLASTDLGPFYDGAAHPWISPEDALTLLALAILAGTGGTDSARRAWMAASAGWSVGLVSFGVWSLEFPLAPVVSSSVLVALGVAGAWPLRSSPGVITVVAGAVGLMRGAFNGVDLALAGGSWVAGIGMAVGALIPLSLLSASSVLLARGPLRVGLRVAGSWIAAVGVLMAGWALRGTP
ncbi:MAG: HupE/UreJ family protein [Myxococcota bacterium]